MTAHTLSTTDTTTARSNPRYLMYGFAGTLFLSAFLLFSIQPFFAKMLLPRLGGSPAVWSVAMVFFQAMLLLGYAYAHVLAKYASLGVATVIHAAVLLAAFVVLPISIPAGWDAPPETGQALWLLGLFGAAVGLPFFAISANSALLQSWFSRSTDPQASDPYFLYGASNIGSFSSLILYIVLIEPMLTIPQQSQTWTAFYGLLVALVIGCAVAVMLTGQRPVETHAEAREAGDATGFAKPLRWMALGFVPSGLLVAVTAHVTTDIAAGPFLWVLPLALFLLTFVIAFKDKPFISIDSLSRIVPILAAIVLFALVKPTALPTWLSIPVHLGFFLMAAFYCHAILYSQRPSAGGLTGFYLWMSVGGVLGGVFASLVAPVSFSWIAEYPLLIIALLFVRPRGLGFTLVETRWFAYGLAATAIGVLVLATMLGKAELSNMTGVVLCAVIALLVVAQFRMRVLYLALLGAVLPLGFAFKEAAPSLFRERTFFGVVEVRTDNTFNAMFHGTTIHGGERLTSDPSSRPEPLTYYHGKSGIASTIKATQALSPIPSGRFGVIGLGTGSVACYARPGEQWSFFEIDRSVVTAARDPKLFRFLDKCGPSMPIVIGDARLTVASEPDKSFNYLLVDAFSSDAIPTHLMTQEALELFRSKLADQGVLVFHISNRYLELGSVMAATAKQMGLPIRLGRFPADPNVEMTTDSLVVAMTNNKDLLAELDADPKWRTPDAGSTVAWSDNYSNIVAALWRRLNAPKVN